MQPQLKRRPSANVSSDIDKLIKTDEWATQPSKDLSGQAGVGEPAAAAPDRAGEGKLPWENANPRIKLVFNLRLPEPLHAKVKYLGETRVGESMHSIIVRGIEAEIQRMLSIR